MSIWLDLQEQVGFQGKRRQWLPTRVLGVNRAYVRCRDKNQPMLLVVGLGRVEPVGIGQFDEDDPCGVMRFLRPLVERLGVSVVVKDGLLSFRTVADQLQVVHAYSTPAGWPRCELLEALVGRGLLANRLITKFRPLFCDKH